MYRFKNWFSVHFFFKKKNKEWNYAYVSTMLSVFPLSVCEFVEWEQHQCCTLYSLDMHGNRASKNINLYWVIFAFILMVICNESLGLSKWNLVWRFIINWPTSCVYNTACKSTFTFLQVADYWGHFWQIQHGIST